MKDRSYRYHINRPRSRRGPKYNKYKMCTYDDDVYVLSNT